MKEYFMRYLNNHKDEILLEMAEMMIEEANKNKGKALEEIEKMRENILSILGE